MSQEAPTGVNPERIKKRIKGREKAKELLALIHHTTLKDAEVMESLLETIRSHSAAGKTPTTSSTTNKPQRSIQSVGAQSLEFGRYKGIPLNEVPLTYLETLIRMVEDSAHLIDEYLNHPDLASYRPHERRVARRK